MNIDPKVYTGRPTHEENPEKRAIYDKLDQLGIPYIRVEHDHADTMEDCLLIESQLGARICKNLFLCNRQGTQFYLLMMHGDKPFKTKFLSAQLGCARMTVTTPAHHDRMIAFTSQLPHVLAGAYVKSPCCLYHAGFSAGSYRDVSRVAAVDETLWAQLFLLNQTALCAEIDGLMERLQACRDAVAAGDRQALTALLREGRERKEEADGALPPLPEHRKERTP